MIQDQLYKVGTYFNDAMHPSLVASLAFGKISHWAIDTNILPVSSKGQSMSIILSGRVEIMNQKRKTLTYLHRGDVLGEIAGLNKLPRLTTALADTDDVYTVSLSKREVSRVCKLFPSFYGTVYQKIKKLESVLS